MAYKMGQRWNDVLTLQKQMKKAGYDPGPLDGIYGQRTQSAYQKYSAKKPAVTNTATKPAPKKPTLTAPKLPAVGQFNYSAQRPTYQAPTNPYAQFNAPTHNPMTYDTAKSQAGDRINPEYAIKLQQALDTVKNQSMGSGFYGQLPQVQLSADTAGQVESQKAIAIADLARQLQADDENRFDKQYGRAFDLWRANSDNFNADRAFGYGQYRDSMGDWSDDRGFAFGQYQDKKDTAYQNFDRQYGSYRDKVGDKQWNKEFDYRQGRDKVSDSQCQEGLEAKPCAAVAVVLISKVVVVMQTLLVV